MIIFRYYWIAMGGSQAFGIRPDDRMYITLPMYHSAGGILGIGQVIYLGLHTNKKTIMYGCFRVYCSYSKEIFC
jgi:acyl-CoA synthetase (AMP-forming)/AMP-acid ligase II